MEVDKKRAVSEVDGDIEVLSVSKKTNSGDIQADVKEITKTQLEYYKVS